MNSKKVKIKSPFYGAGSPKMYNWIKDGFHMFGIGIKVDYLDNYDTLEITVEKKTASVRTKDIRDFADRYNSYYDIKNSTVSVAVFSITLLDPNLKPKNKKPDVRQNTLL